MTTVSESLPNWHLPKYLGYLGGILGAILCTVINWPLRDHVGSTSILFVYLLGVFLVASRFGRGPSVLTCLMSAMGFAYFFAPPLFSLSIADTENLAGLAIMLLVALVTSTLMDSARLQTAIALQRERRATFLYIVSRELALAATEQDVAEIAARQIQAAFGGCSALLFPDAQGQLIKPQAESLPETFTDVDWQLAQKVFDQGTRVGKATATRGESEATLIPLRGAAETVGVLVMRHPGPQRMRVLEQRKFLETFLHLISQSLERVKLAEQARQSSIKAETEALRNALLSTISHDLRTPLTTIVGASGTLAEKDGSLAPEDRRELSQAIHDEAQRMFDLTNKILDMAQLAAGRLPLDREWSAVEEIVGGALGRLGESLKDRPVNIQLPDTMPLIHVDAVLIQQVLVNLLDNAVKYSAEDSPIEISATVAANSLHLFVSDRGPGIPEQVQDRVFEKFFRLHPESGARGVGLGLAISRAIVEVHGGVIGVQNRLGGGAIFSLSLPLGDVPPSTIPEELAGRPT